MWERQCRNIPDTYLCSGWSSRPSFHFALFFFVLVGFVVHEYAHFELFMNFPAICLDFVVFARIAQTNGSKAYLEARLLIDLVIFKAPSVT